MNFVRWIGREVFGLLHPVRPAASQASVDLFGLSRDRRKSRRVEVETQVTVETVDGMRYDGYCRDLSSRGTSALINCDLPLGEKVLLAYYDGFGPHPVVVPAVVRQFYGRRYGLEFCAEDEQDLNAFIVGTCRTAISC